MIKTQFTLYLENRPGALSSVAARLADAGVNIEGLSAASSVDVALLQLIASNAAKTERALKRAGIAYRTQKVAVLPLRNRPGELARVTARLAKAGVNINYVYGTACECDGACNVVVSAPNLKQVEELWP